MKCGTGGALGGVLGLQLSSYGPTWPDQAGGRRRAAPHGGEVLLPVGYCSTSEIRFSFQMSRLTEQVYRSIFPKS